MFCQVFALCLAFMVAEGAGMWPSKPSTYISHFINTWLHYSFIKYILLSELDLRLTFKFTVFISKENWIKVRWKHERRQNAVALKNFQICWLTRHPIKKNQVDFSCCWSWLSKPLPRSCALTSFFIVKFYAYLTKDPVFIHGQKRDSYSFIYLKDKALE